MSCTMQHDVMHHATWCHAAVIVDITNSSRQSHPPSFDWTVLNPLTFRSNQTRHKKNHWNLCRGSWNWPTFVMRIGQSWARFPIFFNLQFAVLQRAQLAVSELWSLQSWANTQKIQLARAGHLRYFFIFTIIKNDFFALFIKLITYFCTSPI